MVLTLLWAVPLAGALFSLLPRAGRVLGLAAALLTAALAFVAWPHAGSLVLQTAWYGPASYRLALGGLGAVLLVMSGLAGVAAVAAAWSGPRAQMAWLLVLLSAANGVFLAADLVLFYVFWEGMLVPAYFLIAGWGGRGSRRAGLQFLAYNITGSLFLLVGVAAALARVSGPGVQVWLLAAFGIGFAVKTPLWPFHGWLADAYAEAPAPAAALIAGVQSKAGLYGFLYLGHVLFPAALVAWRPWLLALGLIGVLYGAFAALAQRQARRLIAYSSLSHLSLVFLGVLALDPAGYSGATLEMWSHGVFTAALFLLVGMLEVRLGGAVDLSSLGGLAKRMPAYAGLLTFAALAALGLPGLAGFPGELLILIGLFPVAPWVTVVAALGVLLAAIYFLRLIQAVLHGPARGAAPAVPVAGAAPVSGATAGAAAVAGAVGGAAPVGGEAGELWPVGASVTTGGAAEPEGAAVAARAAEPAGAAGAGQTAAGGPEGPPGADLRAGERLLLVPLLVPLLVIGLWPQPILALVQGVFGR